MELFLNLDIVHLRVQYYLCIMLYSTPTWYMAALFDLHNKK